MNREDQEVQDKFLFSYIFLYFERSINHYYISTKIHNDSSSNSPQKAPKKIYMKNLILLVNEKHDFFGGVKGILIKPSSQEIF